MSARERGDQVVDDDSVRAAFRLRSLTRIVHYERVHERDAPERGVGPAFR